MDHVVDVDDHLGHKLKIAFQNEFLISIPLERAKSSLVASFANGVAKDEASGSAAISSAWSSGRGKLDLLQARAA
jgi:hypothetical protein